MKKVCAEHLQPGMKMAKDVRGVDGSVFIAKGTILTSGHIESLLDLGRSSERITYKDNEEYKQDLARRCEEYVHPFFYYVNPGSPLFNSLYVETLKNTFDNLYKNGDWFLPCDQELRAVKHQAKRDLFFRGEGGPQDIVSHEIELMSSPATYLKLREVLNSFNCSARNIADIIRLDVNLTAKLMRLVNSPLYRTTEMVNSIEQAVVRLGMEGITSLALGITAMTMFKDIPRDLIDVPTFWRHSISCAIFSQELAREAGLDVDHFFAVGLLHDVGRLLLLKSLPEASLQFFLHARGNFIPLVEAEEVILGYNHAQLGGMLLSTWNCPDELVELVSAHHSPGDVIRSREAAVIQLADNLANAFAIASSGAYVLPGIDEEIWESVELSTDTVIDIFSRHEKALAEVAEFFA